MKFIRLNAQHIVQKSSSTLTLLQCSSFLLKFDLQDKPYVLKLFINMNEEITNENYGKRIFNYKIVGSYQYEIIAPKYDDGYNTIRNYL